MAGNFEYECPHCGTELYGSFGDTVYCSKCDLSFETDYELDAGEESYGFSAWLTGVEHKGKVE